MYWYPAFFAIIALHLRDIISQKAPIYLLERENATIVSILAEDPGFGF